MKILKFLLGIFLLLILGGLGGVIFSDKIVTHITKTPNSEFENVKVSINNGEMYFDNFLVNGKKLGKGEAKLNIKGTGPFNLIPKVIVSSLKLDDVDMANIYNMPNSQIDGLMEKIDAPIENTQAEKTTEQYLKEISTEIGKVNQDVDNFVNNKIKENINNTNKLKEEYKNQTDLKIKAQKINELNKEVKPLSKLINDEKIKSEEAISKIEIEKNIVLDNLSEELTKLEKIIKLNDLNNLDTYIYLDRGKSVVQTLNKSLKVVTLIDEIKKLSLGINDLVINDGKIKFSSLNNDTLNGEITLENNEKIYVKSKNEDYLLSYEKGDLKINSTYKNGEKIQSEINYKKSGLLDNKIVELATEINFIKNNFKSTNKTLLTEEDKKLLLEKINLLEQSKYNEIMAQYLLQTTEIENLVNSTYVQLEKLTQLQKELLQLDKIIPTEVVKNEENINSENSVKNSLENNLQNNSQNNSQNNLQNNLQNNMQNNEKNKN